MVTMKILTFVNYGATMQKIHFLLFSMFFVVAASLNAMEQDQTADPFLKYFDLSKPVKLGSYSSIASNARSNEKVLCLVLIPSLSSAFSLIHHADYFPKMMMIADGEHNRIEINNTVVASIQKKELLLLVNDLPNNFWVQLGVFLPKGMAKESNKSFKNTTLKLGEIRLDKSSTDFSDFNMTFEQVVAAGGRDRYTSCCLNDKDAEEVNRINYSVDTFPQLHQGDTPSQLHQKAIPLPQDFNNNDEKIQKLFKKVEKLKKDDKTTQQFIRGICVVVFGVFVISLVALFRSDLEAIKRGVGFGFNH